MNTILTNKHSGLITAIVIIIISSDDLVVFVDSEVVTDSNLLPINYNI